MDHAEGKSQDNEEAAIAFGNLSSKVALPTVMAGRSLSTSVVRASIAAKTVLDPEVLEVASILNSEGEGE